LPSAVASPLVPGTSIQQINGKRVLRIQLSKDQVQREKQLEFGREQSAKLSNPKSKLGNGVARPMWGDCSGFYSSWDECGGWDSIEYWREDFYGAHQILETVVVKGRRKDECSVAVTSEFGDSYASCDDLKNLFTVPGSQEALTQQGQELEARGLKDIVIDGVDDFVSEVTKPVQKCAKTSPISAIDTPDKDAQQNYIAARDAILTTFAGNINSLRTGDRVDVQYPTGWVVRFIIYSWNVKDGDFWMSKYLDGKANPKNTPCK
jgi:hypothetical protein